MLVPQALAPKPLTKAGAADYLSMSIRTFERNVLPTLHVIRIGAKILVEQEELKRWLDARKSSPSKSTPAPASTTSASGGVDAASMSPRAREIQRRRERRRSGGTPRLFPVGESPR
jgi:hypothetical protein